MSDQSLWQNAASFAAHAHRHGRRKDGQTPYIAHPMRVALTVVHVVGCHDEVAITAALLHDVIEDTATDYDELNELFGKAVADVVAALSKDPRLIEAKREHEYDQRLADGHWRARLIKLADVYDNICDATSDEARRKAADKARRAISLAQGDERLARAVQIVSELLAT